MPNRDLHRPTGAILGLGASLLLATHARSSRPGLEALAGAVGGWIGGALPDWIDPAHSPNHRSTGHSLLGAGSALVFSVVRLRLWQCWFRRQAEAAQSRATAEGATWSLEATLCHALSGLIAGLIAGYIGHLVDDAGTPCGLPIL